MGDAEQAVRERRRQLFVSGRPVANPPGPWPTNSSPGLKGASRLNAAQPRIGKFGARTQACDLGWIEVRKDGRVTVRFPLGGHDINVRAVVVV